MVKCEIKLGLPFMVSVYISNDLLQGNFSYRVETKCVIHRHSDLVLPDAYSFYVNCDSIFICEYYKICLELWIIMYLNLSLFQALNFWFNFSDR